MTMETLSSFSFGFFPGVLRAKALVPSDLDSDFDADAGPAAFEVDALSPFGWLVLPGGRPGPFLNGT